MVSKLSYLALFLKMNL